LLAGVVELGGGHPKARFSNSGRVRDLHGELRAVEQYSIGVQHIAAEQNVRFSLADYRADQEWRQIVDLNLSEKNGKFHHAAGESLKGQSTVLDQAESLDELAGQHGPIGSRVNKGWHVQALFTGAGTPNRDIYERGGRLNLRGVAIANHAVSPRGLVSR
jgi:hypothetical protein